VFAGKALEGRDGLADGEAKLKQAIAAVRANPSSLQAKQQALLAATQLLDQMGSLAANDPRRLSVAKFAVNLANELGPENIPTGGSGGTDVRGLLRVAAQILSRFGSPQDMQAAFKLESLLKAALPASSAAAVAVRAELMQRYGISQGVQGMLAAGWAVRVTNPGEVPKLDLSARTLVLDAAQGNPSLGVMARAYWHDQALRAPAERDGFMEAFRKVANQSSFGMLSRKYREVRDHARRELQQARVGDVGHAPIGSAGPMVDESADMFASLASFSRSSDGAQRELPTELQHTLERFFAPA
jgi:hypothetical protein